MKLSAYAVLPMFIAGLLVLPWSCMENRVDPNLPQSPPPQVITVPAPAKAVKMSTEGRRGQPVEFKVTFTVKDAAYRFSHFEVDTKGKKLYIKVWAKRNPGDMGGQVVVNLTRSGSFTPASTGNYKVYFWQAEDKYLVKTVKVRP